MLVCTRRHLGRRRSGFRLGDADRWLVAGKNEIGPQPLLLFGAILHDCGDGAHVGLDRNAPRRPAYPRHFLDDQRGLEVTPSPTAVGFRNRIAHEARGLQRSDVIERVGFGSINLRRSGCEFGFGQFARSTAELQLLWRQFHIHCNLLPGTVPPFRSFGSEAAQKANNNLWSELQMILSPAMNIWPASAPRPTFRRNAGLT